MQEGEVGEQGHSEGVPTQEHSVVRPLRLAASQRRQVVDNPPERSTVHTAAVAAPAIP